MNIAQARRDETTLPKRNRSPRRRQDYVTIGLFLLPAFVLFLIFLIYPIVSSVYYSLFNWNGIGPAVKFVGLDNFKQILSDQVFIKAAVNAFVDCSVIPGCPVAIGPGAGHHGGT